MAYSKNQDPEIISEALATKNYLLDEMRQKLAIRDFKIPEYHRAAHKRRLLGEVPSSKRAKTSAEILEKNGCYELIKHLYGVHGV